MCDWLTDWLTDWLAAAAKQQNVKFHQNLKENSEC